ncbi:MAG: hypothetical protein HQL62_02370 [Magnetococcales bacterium]|nr:hypothetical protein [Magnetococcales bacterium]
MKKISAFCSGMLLLLLTSGCETTNSLPYKHSTDNVIRIQESVRQKKARLNDVVMAPGVDESVLCRMMGPVIVAPGKTMAEYIRDAFREEMFMAQAYATDAPTIIDGQIDKAVFSSTVPAYWELSMTVRSNHSKGYQAKVKYGFNTSWTANNACKNVADAFGPATQALLKEVVFHPEFSQLFKQ